MKFIFLLFVAFAAAQCASIDDTKEAHDAWNAFQVQYAKKYNSDIEEKFRMKIFMENKLKIDIHNQKYEKGLVSYSQGINKFSDMLHSEIIATHTGFKNTSPDNLKGATYISPANLKVPDSVNWTDKGAVTRVKNQRGCGSCWAFSATGSLEGQVFIKNGKLVELSEQFLVDCSKSNQGCDGGWMDLAYDDIKKIGGIDTEDSYPYEGRDKQCRHNPKNSGANVTGHTFIQQYSEEKLTEAIANIGPIAVAIQVLNSLVAYESGVYYDPDCIEKPDKDELIHAVLAVGYGTDNATGKDYYIVKNSWGKDWGDHGYIKMSRNTVHNCGIAAYAVFPLIKQQ